MTAKINGKEISAPIWGGCCLALLAPWSEIKKLGFKKRWKTQACMPPAAKVDLTPGNNLILPPEEFGRRGQYYFGLSAFEGFEFTDTFACKCYAMCRVDNTVKYGVCHCGVTDSVVPVQLG